MSRNKKPRAKAYRMKPVNDCSGFVLLARKSIEAEVAAEMLATFDKPLNDEQQRDIAIVFGSAITRMAGGKGTEETLHNIIFMCNVSLIMCEQDIGAQYEQDLIEALNGSFRAKLRGEKTGRWGFDGPALVAIRRAYDVHTAQVEIAERRDFKRALDEVTRRINAGDVYREERQAADASRTHPSTEAQSKELEPAN